MEAMDPKVPLARQKGLVVHELQDEVLVYDLDRHRAHSLNRVAAMVWRHCDGSTTVADMTALLEGELRLPPDEELVWLALNRLERAHLLHEKLSLPAGVPNSSRRALLRTAAMVGGLALVTSVVAPEAAYATSTCGTCGTGQVCCHKSNQAPSCKSNCNGCTFCT
jgi:hypothetical protein